MSNGIYDSKSNACERLIGDVGGTNARFALLSEDGVIHNNLTLVSDEYPNIVQAIYSYLETVGSPKIYEAAIAIANPVDGDDIHMTNHDWAFSIEETRQKLDLTRLLFKNDFTALAMSVPQLVSDELQQIGGVDVEQGNALAVVGPGTGLGVSGLVRAGDHWVPLEGEGGHVSISPGNERECEILKACWEDYQHVSAERLISGMGLQNLYNAICKIENVTPSSLSPAEISTKAMRADDACCEEALATFCGLLGSVAGDLVLTLGAFGGVYIGGGIVPKLGNYFETSEFRTRFEAKGRFTSKLKPVPAYIITAKHPALLGIGKAFDLN